jgi:hypothetical protein
MGPTTGSGRDLRPWGPGSRVGLRSPLVASSSPLTGTLDGLRRLEVAGASALELNVYRQGWMTVVVAPAARGTLGRGGDWFGREGGGDMGARDIRPGRAT